MLHFTNQELAKTYHVSVRTVRNWIEAARQGKLDLTLHAVGERSYVANTSRNLTTLKNLSEKGKKYRPHSSQKTVTPRPEFYKLYTQAQLYDLVSNFEIHHEIPRQYNYFDAGAQNWDNYVVRLSEEETPNNLNATINLLEVNRDYIDNLLKEYKQVNVIDVGVGNAMPVKGFLTHLLSQDKLGRYIAIDISPAILKIAEKNVKSWFGDKIALECYALDIEHERFGNLLAEEYIKSNANDTCNLILFFGGTIQNFRKPSSVLSVLHDSMGVKDYLIHSQKLDTESSRRYFDFNPNPAGATLAPNHRFIFDMLNIDDSLYDVEMSFNNELGERNIQVVLKVALSVQFDFQAGQRTISFDKGDKILLWRAKQRSAHDIVEEFISNDLYPLQVSQSVDHEFILTISRIKRDQ